jgi:hypothetical protein
MVMPIIPQLLLFFSVCFMDLCRSFLALFDPFPAKIGKNGTFLAGGFELYNLFANLQS